MRIKEMDFLRLTRLFWFTFCLEQNFVLPKGAFDLNWVMKIYSDTSYFCFNDSRNDYWTFEHFLLLSNTPKFSQTNQNPHIDTAFFHSEKCLHMQAINAVNLKKVQIISASENTRAKDAMYHFRKLRHLDKSILKSLETIYKLRKGRQAKGNSSEYLLQKREDLLQHKKKIMLKVVKVRGIAEDLRAHMLNMSSMQCDIGLLCWMYPIKKVREKREPTCCSGPTIELLALVQSELNIDMYIYEVEDGQFGGNENGSWNGLIGEVLSGKADIAGAGLSITEARSRVVEFAHEFLIDEVCIATMFDHQHLPLINLQVFAALP